MQIGLIVKASKLCNLRCRYCYEFPELSITDRISIDNMTKMFAHLREYLNSTASARKSIRFIWHGGEPFAQPVSYWKSIADAQHVTFGKRFAEAGITNSVQSNLTLVREAHLPLFAANFRLGFSYDVMNNLRVDAAGKPTGRKVREKLNWLLSKRIRPGGIAVLSRSNAEFPEKVARFFLQRDLPFRVLHVDEGKDALPETKKASLNWMENLQFFRTIYDLPIVKAKIRKLWIDPLSTSLRLFHQWQRNRDCSMSLLQHRYAELEWVLAVNTNGDVFSPADCYDPRFRYGNIFSDSIPALLESDGRMQRIERSKERLENVCGKCFLYRKSCDGKYVSHATPEEYRDYTQMGSCYFGVLAQDRKEAVA